MSRAASAPNSRRHPFFWVAAAAALLCLAVYATGALTLWRYHHFEQAFGWTAAATRHGLVVASVERGGTADGKLRPGDRIAGVSSGVIPPIGYYRRAAPADRPYHVYLASPPTRVELTAPLIRQGRAGGMMGVFLAGVTFACVGLFLGLARPDLPVARLFCLAFVCVGFLQLVSSLVTISDQFFRAERLLFGALTLFPGLTNALVLHAAVRLPGPPPPRLIWPGLAIVLYLLGAATLATFGIPSAILWWTDVDVASQILFRWPSWFAAGPAVRMLTELLMSVGALVVVGWKLVFARDAEERRRLRWLFAGCIAANVPFTAYAILQTTLIAGDPGALRESWLRSIANSAGAIAPLAVAYAIAKRRVPDITVVLRRGLQYVLARNALTAVLLIPAAGLAYTVIANQNRTIKEALFQNPTYLALMATALLALRFRRALRQRVDRMFFREAYDRERVLLTLFDDLGRFDSIGEAGARVSAELERALHAQTVTLWVRETAKGTLMPAYSSSAGARRLRIPPDSPLVVALEQNPGAIDRTGLRDRLAADWVWLEPLAAELIVPITGSDGRLRGLLMLGARKSEEPYGPDDIDLLEAIANQLAVLSENLRLKERVDEERRVRDAVVNRLEGRAINVVKECPRCGACYDSAAVQCTADGEELTMSLPVERVVDGQYRLDRLIGRGGMGSVYEAEDLRLQRKVAIKFLIGRGFGEQAAMRRFEREARTCARLSHPNIVTVFDYGTLPAEGAYLVMERLYGTTLRDELIEMGWLQPLPAVDLFDQILEGVKAAHAQGIVHRDLKPENVLIAGPIGGARHVKLLDFGLARVRAGDTAVTASVSIAGVVMGTLGYMAPEQFGGGIVDERADIFAFGVMLAEAVTGRRPFDRPTLAAVMSSTQLDPFHLIGDAPATRTLDRVLQRCLAKDPDSRFASADELQRELIPAMRACAPDSLAQGGAQA